MPCDAIDEILELRCDVDDRLLDYSLMKETCGAPIGEASLLLDWLRRQTIDGILALPAAALHEQFAYDDREAFLYHKHFYALQGALGVVTGAISGGAEDACALISLGYDDGLTLRARIAVDTLGKTIKACGGCRGCGRDAKTAHK